MSQSRNSFAKGTKKRPPRIVLYLIIAMILLCAIGLGTLMISGNGEEVADVGDEIAAIDQAPTAPLEETQPKTKEAPPTSGASKFAATEPSVPVVGAKAPEEKGPVSLAETKSPRADLPAGDAPAPEAMKQPIAEPQPAGTTQKAPEEKAPVSLAETKSARADLPAGVPSAPEAMKQPTAEPQTASTAVKTPDPVGQPSVIEPKADTGSVAMQNGPVKDTPLNPTPREASNGAATPQTAPVPPAQALANVTQKKKAASDVRIVRDGPPTEGARKATSAEDDFTSKSGKREPQKGFVQNPRELSSFKEDVMGRIDDADSVSYSEERKKIAREAVANLQALHPVCSIQFTEKTAIANEKQALSELKASLQSSEVQTLLAGNKKAAFIVLGFADPSGTAQINRALSKGRAETVRDHIKRFMPDMERINPLGVGQTSRFDSGEKMKNRVAEVWLAIPSE